MAEFPKLYTYSFRLGGNRLVTHCEVDTQREGICQVSSTKGRSFRDKVFFPQSLGKNDSCLLPGRKWGHL
ncbi:hypothetical protein DACRYDRAFT_24697, partial [Dacryopinax primogenitus]